MTTMTPEQLRSFGGAAMSPMLDLLRLLEWASPSECCLECHHLKGAGHAPDCHLDRAIRGLAEQSPGEPTVDEMADHKPSPVAARDVATDPRVGDRVRAPDFARFTVIGTAEPGPVIVEPEPWAPLTWREALKWRPMAIQRDLWADICRTAGAVIERAPE